MCGEGQFSDDSNGVFTRRDVGALGLASFIAAYAPSSAMAAVPLTEEDFRIDSKAGVIDGFFVAPSGKKSPAVILWPDIAGVRETMKAMARRLAGQGYAVLVPNHYYRDAPAPHWKDFADFLAQDGWGKARAMRAKLNASAIMDDARALIQYADTRAEVDAKRPAGAQGYCMGGAFAFWSAAALPKRFGAVASFHGGGLADASSKESPHLLLGGKKTHYLVAVAKDDDAKSPQAKDVLKSAFSASHHQANVEVYAADHGWCVPDSPAYNELEAERAWNALLGVYTKGL